ncbi:hypothetical protein YPPY54_1705, partial [Yersinia pestis PY-54]|jgi:hypothetical protein
MWRG